jgi:hypothetical protein
MTFRILLLAIMVSQVACGQHSFKNQNKQFAFVDSLLKKEDAKLEILDFAFSPDLQEILARFQKAMAENKEWMQEYFSKNYKEGEGLPYNEKFGISEDKYQKIKDMEKSPPSVVVKRSVPIKINHSSGYITFTTTEDDAKFIDWLKIDLQNELLFFNSDTIPFTKEIHAPSSTPFGEWNGYKWSQEISNLGEHDEVKFDKLISKIIEVDFGKIKSSDKALLILKYKDIDKGQVHANLDVACYIE